MDSFEYAFEFKKRIILMSVLYSSMFIFSVSKFTSTLSLDTWMVISLIFLFIFLIGGRIMYKNRQKFISVVGETLFMLFLVFFIYFALKIYNIIDIHEIEIKLFILFVIAVFIPVLVFISIFPSSETNSQLLNVSEMNLNIFLTSSQIVSLNFIIIFCWGLFFVSFVVSIITSPFLYALGYLRFTFTNKNRDH